MTTGCCGRMGCCEVRTCIPVFLLDTGEFCGSTSEFARHYFATTTTPPKALGLLSMYRLSSRYLHLLVPWLRQSATFLYQSLNHVKYVSCNLLCIENGSLKRGASLVSKTKYQPCAHLLMFYVLRQTRLDPEERGNRCFPNMWMGAVGCIQADSVSLCVPSRTFQDQENVKVDLERAARYQQAQRVLPEMEKEASDQHTKRRRVGSQGLRSHPKRVEYFMFTVNCRWCQMAF